MDVVSFHHSLLHPSRYLLLPCNTVPGAAWFFVYLWGLWLVRRAEAAVTILPVSGPDWKEDAAG